MASKAKQIKDFQIDFLKFLNDKDISEVHIYHYLMNYWSNDSSSVASLQLLKDSITDLCDRKLVVSKNNAHISLGLAGIPEEEQKNNAICMIREEGKAYLKKAEAARKLKSVFVLSVIIAVVFLLWHNRKMIRYFFR
jgi:hypothetical protein